MSACLLAFILLAAQNSLAPGDARPVNANARDARIDALVQAIAVSGRAMEIRTASERLSDPRRSVAPGAPPLLSFRYFEGAQRHRFGKLDIMLDDAGH